MKKIITASLVTIIILMGSAQADNYALTGTFVGSGILATTGIVLGEVGKNQCYAHDCGDWNSFIVGSAIGGAFIGGLIGAGIGALIPRESKITFSPTITPNKDGVNIGGNLAIRF